MKAPDKIYVREYPDGIARFWEEKKKEDVVETIPHEYIRKDALMEWLQQGFDWTKNPVISVQQIIDKLNSM